ncbi:autophagy-related protein 13-domain-containing protein [Mycena epipterygia]|nr:autophagy-related protein 13-domain-containing protein [Mycena epipterygia]
MAPGDSAKADQIAFHIFTKLFHVLHAARASDQGPPSGKTDKWFNLETPIAAPGNTPTSELDLYRSLSSFSSTSAAPRPLTVQILLAVPPPGGGTALVHTPSRTRVEPQPRLVLLEEWVLAFSPPSSSASSTDEADVLPPTIYKNAIPLFRALYALLRILPAWRVVRKLAGRRAAGVSPPSGVNAGGKGRGMRVVVRLRPEDDVVEGGAAGLRGMGMGGEGNGGNGEDTILAFGDSPAPETGAAPLPTSTHVFPGIPHPAGESSFRRF